MVIRGGEAWAERECWCVFMRAHPLYGCIFGNANAMQILSLSLSFAMHVAFRPLSSRIIIEVNIVFTRNRTSLRFVDESNASSAFATKDVKLFLEPCRCWRCRRHGLVFLPRWGKTSPSVIDEVAFPEATKGLVADHVWIAVEVW